jgi:CheY-like chemotaxis protein
MKQILIVDDEILFTRSLAEGLSALEHGWSVLTAKNGKEATDLLEGTQIHLVATDLKMPVMDGFQLLAHLATHHGDIPVIVMSAFATPEMEEKLQTLGIDQVLEKPLDLVTFHEKVRSSLEASARGFVRGITLPTFLQMIEMERKTCTITVTMGDRSGCLYFRKGVLLDAEVEDLRGPMAAMDVLSWDETAIEIRNACKVGKRVITFGLQHLLLECMRIKDEEANREGPCLNSAAVLEAVASTGSYILPFPPDSLEPLTDLDGLLGLAIMAGDGKVLLTWPEGSEDSLAQAADSGHRIATATRQACDQMMVGRSLLVHVDAEGGHILVMGFAAPEEVQVQDPPESFYVLLVMDPDCQMGMARMKMRSFEQSLVPAPTAPTGDGGH